MTCVAVVKDREKNRKSILFDHHIAPDLAILDPLMVEGLPARITAFTGMDALTHAVEAVHSLQSDPIADGLALYAIRLIAANLPRCVEDGGDLVARGQMQIGASMAGMAFTNAMLGIVHAMAHAVGARYGVPHGLIYNLDECSDRYALVAEALGVRKPEMTETEAARAAARAIRALAGRLGLPQKLREVNVPKEGLKDCAGLSLSDGSIIYNSKPVFEAGEILKVYEEAW